MSAKFNRLAGSRPFFSRSDFLILYGLAVLLRLAFWIMGARLVPPSSDESITMLLAQQITRGKFPLLFMGQPYLFPIESYLSVLWAWLPPGGGTARLTCLLLGFATAWFALKLVPWEGGRCARWLAGLLAIFPSFYLLILQGFYALPGYSFLMLSCVALPFLVLYPLRQDKLHGALLVGLLAGLSFSAHPLSLCASIPALLVLLIAERPLLQTGTRCMAAIAGVLIGLLPFLLALLIIPGAHEMATSTLPWQEIVSRWWGVGPRGALPIAMGLRALNFPAAPAYAPLLPGLGLYFAVLLGVFLAVLLIWRIHAHTRGALQGRWPRWEASDFMLAMVLINITLVAAAPRAHFDSCRYLLPAALALPLIFANLITQSVRPLRILGALAGLALLLAQLPTAWRVARDWRQPGFAERASVPDLQPALEGLRKLDLHAAFASYGAAYRLTYESGGSIVASQRKNERFLNWPIPYLSSVTSSPRVAYVLTDAISYLKPGIFETQLVAAGVSARVMTTGAFRIYYDFDQPRQRSARRLPPESIHVAAPRQEIAHRISDGARDNPWRKPAQQIHDAIVLSWPDMQPLDHLMIHYGVKEDYPRTLNLLCHDQNGWHELMHGRKVDPAPFSMDRGYPVHGTFMEFIDLNSEEADGVRLEINEARLRRDWNITEIEIYARHTDQPHAAL